MKKLAAAVVMAFVLSVANLTIPKTASAGCQCSACQCTRDTTVSVRCKCEGVLCIMGPTGSNCSECLDCFAAVDGVISRESDVVATAPREAVLTRRSCDGAVVGRQYTTAMAGKLRTETRTIRV